MILQINQSVSIVRVDHPIKHWVDRETKNEQTSDNLLVSVFDSSDGTFGVLRFRDPSPSLCDKFKVGGKIPLLRVLRNSEEKGVQFIDCEVL